MSQLPDLGLLFWARGDVFSTERSVWTSPEGWAGGDGGRPLHLSTFRVWLPPQTPCVLSDFACSRTAFRVPPALLLALGGGVGRSSAGSRCGICWDQAEGTEDTLFWFMTCENVLLTEVAPSNSNSSRAFDRVQPSPSAPCQAQQPPQGDAGREEQGRGCVGACAHAHRVLRAEAGYEAERDQDSEACGHRSQRGVPDGTGKDLAPASLSPSGFPSPTLEAQWLTT